jgi:hypothetical protein
MTKRGCFRILPSKSACLADDTGVSLEYDLACLDLSEG